MSGDTAGAAREVAEAQDPTRAAIAPPLAAEIYGPEILRSDVEDEDHNTTRFIVLSRDFEQAPRDNGPIVTTFIFNVRNLPAALYKALGGFATNGVNMTKLESYMVDGHFTATQFPAEVDGHPEDPGVKNALEELEFFTTEVKVLGAYPADSFRDS
ncbi:prephenate dehydratase domain-containing protein [Nocardioides sp. B-3]|uniref:prephenate dehydratase domain-containing protein n=1 Tax=Nocardioides sp. B-3 TaxID=2895565 RepID=UPI002152943E|nr:prephenate dehydratase domain-containing protein [Nocardioides sp. B-3]